MSCFDDLFISRHTEAADILVLLVTLHQMQLEYSLEIDLHDAESIRSVVGIQGDTRPEGKA